MTRLVSEGGVTRWLQRAIGVALALAVIAWLLVTAPEAGDDKTPLAIELPRAEELASAGGEIDAAIQRPLFWAERKPVAEGAATDGGEAAGGGDAADAAAGQAVFGFVATMLEADQRYAIVRSDSSGMHRVREGDSVDGWLVTRIAPRGITLTSDQGTVDLEPPEKPTVTLSEVQKKAAAPRPTAAAAGEAPAAEEQVRDRGRERRSRRNADRAAAEPPPRTVNQEEMSAAMESLGDRLRGMGQLQGEKP